MTSLIIGARKDNGQFGRTHYLWDGKNWDDGFVDNNGRFRVFRPDYPRCYRDGYAFRHHIVYWLNTGHVPLPEEVVHHKDENKTNDVFSNLELMTKIEHDNYHKNKMTNKISLICDWCGKEFKRVRYRTRRGQSHNFCSRKCNILHRWGVREK